MRIGLGSAKYLASMDFLLFNAACRSIYTMKCALHSHACSNYLQEAFHFLLIRLYFKTNSVTQIVIISSSNFMCNIPSFIIFISTISLFFFLLFFSANNKLKKQSNADFSFAFCISKFILSRCYSTYCSIQWR